MIAAMNGHRRWRWGDQKGEYTVSGRLPKALLNLPPDVNSKVPVAFQKEACHYLCWKPKGRFAMKEKPDVLQGTLALMVLKTLDVLGWQHGWGTAGRIEQISRDPRMGTNRGGYRTLFKVKAEDVT
jgi:hypothetical protein